VCVFLLKEVSVIQNSLMPFRLSKLWNFINTERVSPNSKIIFKTYCMFT